MYSKKWVFAGVICIWVALLCFAGLQLQQEAPTLLVTQCMCLSFSLGILATFMLLLQARKLAEDVKEIRALLGGLYAYFFTMSIFVMCLLSTQLRQSSSLSTSLVSLAMGLISIGTAIWLVILGMRALRVLEGRPGGK